MFDPSCVRVTQHAQRPGTPHARSPKGNMVVLALAITVGLLVAIGLFVFNYTRILGGHEQHATAIEASSLAAAQAIARIVVEDPNYGFIALTDYPPIGQATIAGDGEPLPVLGINTVVGTARLDMIVAHELGDETMKMLAKKDVENARAAARRLTEVLKKSLRPGGDPLAKDLDGQPVTPYETAKNLYESNQVKNAMGGSCVTGSFKLSLGYLDGGSTTLTPIPEPEEFAAVQADQKQDGNYKAFINIPAKGEDFYFAGLGSETRLVNTQRFREDDGIRIPSIVKVEADHTITEVSAQGSSSIVRTIHNVACSQPGGTNDNPPGGTICISFPSGPAPDISKVKDILKHPQLTFNKGQFFSPEGGDWPGEGTLTPSVFIPGEPTPAQMWAVGLYHWVRSGRTKPNVKDLKDMQEVAFDNLGQPGDMNTVWNRQWLQMAMARSENSVVPAGIVSTSVGGNSDPRMDSFTSGSLEAQRAYWRLAGFTSELSELPANAFVVGIDASGKLYSADGSTALREKDIHEFWVRVAETNTAGLVAMALANRIRETVQATVAATLQQINETKNAIERLRSQLASDPEVAANPERQAQIQAEINRLSELLPTLEQSLGQHQAEMDKAEDAYRNGSQAASVTDTIVRNQRTLSAQGFRKDGATFILAGNRFTPHPLPPVSIDAILNDQAASGDAAGTLWTAKTGFEVYTMPTGITLSVRPHTSSMLPPAHAQAKSLVPAGASKLFMFEFSSSGHIIATSLPQQPFLNIPLSDRQLLGLAYGAMTSGNRDSATVTWTATLRDFTARLGRQQGGKHAGEPMVGSPGEWCELTTYGNKRKSKGSKGGKGSKGSKGGKGSKGSKGGKGNEGIPPGQAKKLARGNYFCPGLSTEFQLRTPLIGNGGSTAGSPLVLKADRATTMFGEPSSGPATVSMGGQTYTIPGTSNFSITSKPGPIGPPSTMSPGGSTATSTMPAAPADLL